MPQEFESPTLLILRGISVIGNIGDFQSSVTSSNLVFHISYPYSLMDKTLGYEPRDLEVQVLLGMLFLQLAQWIEHEVSNLGVGSSNLSLEVKVFKRLYYILLTKAKNNSII